MQIKWNRALSALGVVVALAAPSAALAHDGGDTSRGGVEQAQSGSGQRGSGSGDQRNAQGSDQSAGDRDSGGEDSPGSGGSQRNDAARNVRYDLRGTVVSVDPQGQTITVAVAKANHGRRGRAYVGQTMTFDVSSARLNVRDVNADGARDLNDVAAGDGAEVRAALARSGSVDLTSPAKAERVKDRTKDHADSGQHPDDGANHG